MLYTGRPTTSEQDFQLTGQVACEGELAYLLDTVQEKHTYGSQSAENGEADTNRKILAKMVDMHNIQVGAEKRFTCGIIDVDEEPVKMLTTNFESTWSSIDTNFLQKYDGYLRIRHDRGINYLDYVKRYGRVNNQAIRLGENLLDIQKSVKTEDVRTAIIPMGANNITVANATGHDGSIYVRDSEAIKEYGWIVEKVDFSDINNPDDLLVEAKKYLAKRVKPTVSIELTAVDLSLLDADIQAFRLGDLVPLTSDIHGVSSTIGDVNTYYPISKIELDLENPTNSKITLGATRPTLSSNLMFGFNSDMETYTEFQGTEGISDGVAGLVPAPKASEFGNSYGLGSDGTWRDFGETFVSQSFAEVEYATNEALKNAIEELKKYVDKQSPGGVTLDSVYPVGSIYISVNDSFNPNDVFPGTWISFGKGRTLVGVDTSDLEFQSAEDTGGEKTHVLTVDELPEHNHDVTVENKELKGSVWNFAGQGATFGPGNSTSGVFSKGGDGTCFYPSSTGKATGVNDGFIMDATHKHTATSGNTGSGMAHNNMMPYITVYMWKRTA